VKKSASAGRKGLLRLNTGRGKENKEMKIPIAATAFGDFHLFPF
jgi:hypothetical protein